MICATALLAITALEWCACVIAVNHLSYWSDGTDPKIWIICCCTGRMFCGRSMFSARATSCVRWFIC